MIRFDKTWITKGCLIFHNKNNINLTLSIPYVKKIDDNDIKIQNSTKIDTVEFFDVLDAETITTFKSTQSSMEIYEIQNLDSKIGIYISVNTNENNNDKIINNDNDKIINNYNNGIIEHIIFYSLDLIPLIVSAPVLNSINRFINVIYENSTHSKNSIFINYLEQCRVFAEMNALVEELGIEKIDYSPFTYDVIKDRYNKLNNNEQDFNIDLYRITEGDYNLFYEPKGTRSLFYATNRGVYIVEFDHLKDLIKNYKYGMSDYGKIKKRSRFETFESFGLYSGYILDDESIILDDCYYYDKNDISEYDYKDRMTYVSKFIDDYYVNLQEHDYDAVQEKIILEQLNYSEYSEYKDTSSYVTEMSHKKGSKFMNILAITSKHIESMAVFRSMNNDLFQPYAHDYDVGGIVFKPHKFTKNKTFQTKYTSGLLEYMNFKFGTYDKLPEYFVDMILLKLDRIIYELNDKNENIPIIISTCSKAYNLNISDSFMKMLFDQCMTKLKMYNHYPIVNMNVKINSVDKKSGNEFLLLFADSKLPTNLKNNSQYIIGWDPLIIRGFFNSPFKTATYSNFVAKIVEKQLFKFEYNSNSNTCNFQGFNNTNSIIDCNFTNIRNNKILNSKLNDTLRDYMRDEFLVLYKFIN
jgi:hypothetical protein